MRMFRQNKVIKMPPVSPGSALKNLHLFVSAAASAITATAEITSGSKYRIAKRTSSIISAQEDLRNLHDYIARDDADAADRWIDNLVKNFDVLTAARNREEAR